MGKALMVATNGAASSLISGDELNVFGYGNDTTTEANAQASATEACTFSGLAFNVVSGGSGTNNIRFRDAGADGQQLATIAGAGIARDAVNSDVLSAADLFNLAYTDNGTDSAPSWVSANVAFASGHGSYHLAAKFNGSVFDVASAVRFIALNGPLPIDGTATEANVCMLNRAYDTFAAMQVRVTANARLNDSVFKNRIAGADGTGLITFATLETGLKIDTGIGDALSAAQAICASLTLDTGVEDLTVAFVGATLKSSTVKSESWVVDGGIARAASATPHYCPIGGAFPSTLAAYTEAQSRVMTGFVGTASGLRCYLSANTYTVAGTLSLFKNGVSVLVTPITISGGAGWYENTADSVTFDADDELSFEFLGGTTGSITIMGIGITLEDTTGGAASNELGALTQDIGWRGLQSYGAGQVRAA